MNIGYAIQNVPVGRCISGRLGIGNGRVVLRLARRTAKTKTDFPPRNYQGITLVSQLLRYIRSKLNCLLRDKGLDPRLREFSVEFYDLWDDDESHGLIH